MTKWTKERLENIDKPRDAQPGWNMVSTPAVYLAVMAQAVPGQGAVSPDELERIAGHLVRHQEADGSWAWSNALARNRPPPVFESDEVVTLLAYVALGPHVPYEKGEVSGLSIDCYWVSGVRFSGDEPPPTVPECWARSPTWDCHRPGPLRRDRRGHRVIPHHDSDCDD